MYKIELETLRKLVDINNWLNQIEVKGMQNLQLLSTSIVSIQQILQKIDDENKDNQQNQNQQIIVDNTKEGK